MRQFIALAREVFVKVNVTLSPRTRNRIETSAYRVPPVALFCIALCIAGCGGQLGTIKPPEVETALTQAESAIEKAREVDAPSLAADAFNSAEANLAAAKTALKEKRGSEALRLAYQATADAKVAYKVAVDTAKNAALNATILEKEASAKKLRKTLTTKEAQLAKAQERVQELSRDEEQLKRRMSRLEKEKRELRNKRETYGKQVSELRETLESIQARSKRAETEIRSYGKEIAELRRKLEVADKMIREEGHQKRAAIAAAESLRKQLREQAEIYTDKLARANQRSSAAKHEDYLKEKAAEARAFVQSQRQHEPVKTGRTSLSTEQIAAGKVALSRWNTAWDSKNLSAHLAFYAPNVIADKVVIRESKEHRTKIDRGQLEAALRPMNAHPWRKIKGSTEVERESVIGIYRLSRLVAPAENEDATALYNIWIREVWMHQVGAAWKIHHEIWQIYENVPNF